MQNFLKVAVVVALVLVVGGGSAVAKPFGAPDQKPVMVKGMHWKDSAEKADFERRMTLGASTSIVATPDGGVIVLVGGRLKKFDKDLNLVREIVVDPSWSAPKSAGCPTKKGGAVVIQKKEEPKKTKK